MSHPIEISDDEDDFCEGSSTMQHNTRNMEPEITISDDDECLQISDLTEENLTSDEDYELPSVNLKKAKSGVIKKLFSTAKNDKPSNPSNSRSIPAMFYAYSRNKPTYSFKSKENMDIEMPQCSKTMDTQTVSKMSQPIEPKVPGYDKMIGGVTVNLPVDPYGCQIALMSKVITAIKKGQNCLLESPTGTGKTLALLCSALAWQRYERNRIGQTQAQAYFSHYPELNKVEGAAEYIGSPSKFFNRTVFGEKNIYDKPGDDNAANDKPHLHQAQDFNKGDADEKDEINYGCKRPEPLHDSQDSPNNGLVSIHPKRQKLNPEELIEDSNVTPTSSPQKLTDKQSSETPQQVRNLYSLVDNLHLRTSTLVDCSTPTIYYGARTHKQIQQVIKEFRRTSYCGEAKMTVLSSREYSCIREFDRNQWSSKNDMCRGCVKTNVKPDDKSESNCKFYENRAALNHNTLPPAFDLEDLVGLGEEKVACPYYAARMMAKVAHIVFCPYNYLIEPSIRSSLQIDLRDNIVIIDEAHNIEDICRDAASFTFTRDHIQSAIKELEKVSDSRYANSDAQAYIGNLLKTLSSWDYWFANQSQLVKDKAMTNNEAVYTWQPEHFVQTLHNHNIGQKQYSEFKQTAALFCQRLRDDPRTLLGVTQATGSLVEALDTVLGYLFRCDGKYMDDFTPALVRTVTMESSSDAGLWRRSNFAQRVEKEIIELRLMCMNSAVVFESLKVAKCIILASGTLTPLISLYSELDTEFPLKVSPGHVIPKERVWVGTLTTCPDGQPLQCKSYDTAQPGVQDALGQAVLWVSRVTPNGVLCFMPSYRLMELLVKRWRDNNMWTELHQLKHVFMEARNVRDHNDIMEDYYKYAESEKGAILFAVFRGKVSEGMDFKDYQARAVVTIGIPYPNLFDIAVQAKVSYNDKYSKSRNLLPKSEWLLVQAYRALNQAVGRCVRHRGDWGAVLLIDARFQQNYYTQHLSGWVRNMLGNKHYTYESLVNSVNSLESFMQSMTISENEDV